MSRCVACDVMMPENDDMRFLEPPHGSGEESGLCPKCRSISERAAADTFVEPSWLEAERGRGAEDHDAS